MYIDRSDHVYLTIWNRYVGKFGPDGEVWVTNCPYGNPGNIAETDGRIYFAYSGGSSAQEDRIGGTIVNSCWCDPADGTWLGYISSPFGLGVSSVTKRVWHHDAFCSVGRTLLEPSGGAFDTPPDSGLYPGPGGAGTKTMKYRRLSEMYFGTVIAVHQHSVFDGHLFNLYFDGDEIMPSAARYAWKYGDELDPWDVHAASSDYMLITQAGNKRIVPFAGGDSAAYPAGMSLIPLLGGLVGTNTVTVAGNPHGSIWSAYDGNGVLIRTLPEVFIRTGNGYTPATSWCTKDKVILVTPTHVKLYDVELNEINSVPLNATIPESSQYKLAVTGRDFSGGLPTRFAIGIDVTTGANGVTLFDDELEIVWSHSFI